ncbi:hypothetical protein HU200_049403 [Digitaria exilis]|uniref:RING-type domain-containing protein n=1 Tax=Digitaria exilis TaxID=1010633 RepID=A0A835AZB4_9POAL|nr:hypothetical protein HU200_049403 [Digitaria exilis]
MAAATTDTCAICLYEISRGQAVFVAECSHTFHHRCISESIAHGNRDCPLCKATWHVVPSVDTAAHYYLPLFFMDFHSIWPPLFAPSEQVLGEVMTQANFPSPVLCIFLQAVANPSCLLPLPPAGVTPD